MGSMDIRRELSWLRMEGGTPLGGGGGGGQHL